MRILLISSALLVLGCVGCATRTSPSPQGEGSTTTTTAPPKVSLAAEQRRLADLFRGTPVVFSMQRDGSLRVTVPLRYSFDAGRHAVKPPLAAVLDRIASSQRAEATHLVVSAPADPQGRRTQLATERATSARDYMVGRGVDATRFSIAATDNNEALVVLVADTSAH